MFIPLAEDDGIRIGCRGHGTPQQQAIGPFDGKECGRIGGEGTDQGGAKAGVKTAEAAFRICSTNDVRI
jgi:hypothetical protein